MKRFIVILLLFPSLAFGAFTEFYCQTGGSNLNAGSTTSNSAAYTSTNGNWNGTSTFTPTDGSTPASSVNVGDFASVYLDAATAAVYIARVTSVAAGVNGAIGLSTTFKAGSPPASGATGRSIKVGGAWKGPNAAVTTPFGLTTLSAATDASRNKVRVNMLGTFTPTSSLTTNGTENCVVQGYTSSPGDGGKAVIDFSTNAAGWSNSSTNVVYTDLEFKTTASSGTTDLVTAAVISSWHRVVAHGARGCGFNIQAAGCLFEECEAYGNNTSNTSGNGAFKSSHGMHCVNCTVHDNTGSNTAGFAVNNLGAAHTMFLFNCIIDTNGGNGITAAGGSSSADTILVQNCDFYNNAGDGIAFTGGTTTAQSNINVINTNFIKNTGKGINIAPGAGGNTIGGFAYNNGYGAGTQANGSSDALSSLVESGKVTYASNVTPWVDPANGDFRINLVAAMNTGRGVFTETAASYAGTIGYPDIGAANHNDTCGGTGPCQTSGASAQ